MDSDTLHPGRGARRTRVTALLAAGVIATAFAPAALGAGTTVTRGDFAAFAAGTGLPITGRAQMVRTADGRTVVTIHLEGLEPGLTYGSHVHKQACADGEADGHYRFDPAGAAVPPNEIWPGPFATNEAGVGNGYTIADGTAGPTAMSVVVHAPVTGAKIACADLS
jgi:hypothetical protein